MGLYSLYNNATDSCRLEWSIQSALTHFLAENFDSIQANSTKTLKNNQFNDSCNTFRNKLTYIDPIKFPRFGTCLVAIDEIISVLCNDNIIGRQMKCLSCEKNVSNLFQKSLNPHLWTKHAEDTGYLPSLDITTIQEWSFVSLTACKTTIHPSDHQIVFCQVPCWLWFEVWPQVKPKTLPSISLDLPSSNGYFQYELNTIIYHGMNHFTCSFIDDNKHLWFHDRQQNQGNPIFLNKIDQIQFSDLIEFEGQFANIYIYQRL